MFKFLSLVLATTSIGAFSAASAQACGCCGSSSCCATAAAPSCCTATAPADTGAAAAQVPAAPNATRSYSYEPSMGANSAPSRARVQTPSYLVPKSMR
jgi:hypothetical protein